MGEGENVQLRNRQGKTDHHFDKQDNYWDISE